MTSRIRARMAPLALALAVAAVAVAPHSLGFSGGINKDNAPAGLGFDTVGCTACHGPAGGEGGHKQFASGATERVSWTILDDKGAPLKGNVYEHGKTYTITVTLNETNKPDAKNHGGFNLRASAGKLSAVAGQSQVSKDQSQATHLSAARTSWQAKWEAPAEGAAVFDLFVNDVDGSGAPDEPDRVYRVGFYLLGDKHELPGAVKAEAVEYGISLQQYWIGLIGLAGMIVVMLAGFVYLKYVNPHNTDQKDR